MNATELFKAGQLAKAVDAQIQEVKAHPADANRRLFLFELLLFTGDLDRAKRQGDLVKYDSIELESAMQSYRKLLDAEAARRKVFREGAKPMFIGEVPEHVTLRLDAINRLREGNTAEATALLHKAAEATPPAKGTLNGKPVEGVRDCDDVLSGVLEASNHGHYFWVPLEQVVALKVTPPKFPRDLCWVTGHMELAGSVGDVFLPALYPFSHEHADEAVKLGRQTDWLGAGDDPVRGAGLKLFLADEDAVPLLEWKEFQAAGGA